jgi:hypothetical protein
MVQRTWNVLAGVALCDCCKGLQQNHVDRIVSSSNFQLNGQDAGSRGVELQLFSELQ